MFCAKCGKKNVEGSIKCKFCGEKMPPVAQSNGFSDILNYDDAKSVEDVKNEASKLPAATSGAEEREDKKNGVSKIGVAAFVISILALIVAATCLVMTLRGTDAINEAATETEKKPDHTKEELENEMGIIVDLDDENEAEEPKTEKKTENEAATELATDETITEITTEPISEGDPNTDDGEYEIPENAITGI